MSEPNSEQMREVYDFLNDHLAPPQFILFYRGAGDHVHVLTNQEQEDVVRLCQIVVQGEITWKRSFPAKPTGSC